MIILGLAGQAGSGKDTVALYLQERYGFIPFSFSDALYREVAAAFGLENEDLLRDRATKEVPCNAMRLVRCTDSDFKVVARKAIARVYPDTFGVLDDYELSPRFVLQTWGMEYRRAADPDYWVKAARDWMDTLQSAYIYAETRPQNFVNCSVRFENERHFLKGQYWDSSVWHIHRDNIPSVNPHESETPLPVLDGEREIWNNYTIEYLHMGIDQLMSSNIPSIRIEPPEPMQPPEGKV